MERGLFMYLRTRDLQNTLYHPAWSSAEAVLFRHHPLFHLWRLPEIIPSKLDASIAGCLLTQRTIAKLFTPRIFAGFRLH